MTTNMVPAINQEAIESFKVKMATQRWVQCPCCLEEWTELRPCAFVIDKRRGVTHLCVDCAEGVRAFGWINSQQEFEIPTIRINTVKYRGFYDVSTDSLGRKCYQTFANLGELGFTIQCQYSGEVPLIVCESKNKEVKRYFNNSIQAWVFIREFLLDSLAGKPPREW